MWEGRGKQGGGEGGSWGMHQMAGDVGMVIDEGVVERRQAVAVNLHGVDERPAL
jgi:hypothetical protein